MPDLTAAFDEIEYVGVDPLNQRDTLNRIIVTLSSPTRAAFVDTSEDGRQVIPELDAENIGDVVNALRETVLATNVGKRPLGD